MTALALLAAIAITLGGCGSATVQMRGIAPMNVNDTDESTPVDVRLFALNADAKFLGAGFETLWSDAPGVLGGDLVGKPVQAAVYPGAAGDAPVSVSVPTGGAGWIGIMALYRKSDGLPRTLAVRVDEADDCVLELTGYGMRWEGASVDGTMPGSAPAQTQTAPPAAAPKNTAAPKKGR